MDEYTGEIRIFAGNFAPRNWMYCNGQLLSVQQNRELFAIIGKTYGGDGIKDFALPNLQGKVPVGAGAGNGLTARALGDSDGTHEYTVSPETMPSHAHTLNGTTRVVNSVSPENAYSGNMPAARTSTKRYSAATAKPNATLNPASLTIAGTEKPDPVSTVQPYLAVGYIICISGEYPVKPR